MNKLHHISKWFIFVIATIVLRIDAVNNSPELPQDEKTLSDMPKEFLSQLLEIDNPFHVASLYASSKEMRKELKAAGHDEFAYHGNLSRQSILPEYFMQKIFYTCDSKVVYNIFMAKRHAILKSSSSAAYKKEMETDVQIMFKRAVYYNCSN